MLCLIAFGRIPSAQKWYRFNICKNITHMVAHTTLTFFQYIILIILHSHKFVMPLKIAGMFVLCCKKCHNIKRLNPDNKTCGSNSTTNFVTQADTILEDRAENNEIPKYICWHKKMLLPRGYCITKQEQKSVRVKKQSFICCHCSVIVCRHSKTNHQ